MKKKIIIAACTCFAAFATVTFVNSTDSNPEMSLLMQNVEALADAEEGTVVYYACKYIGCCGGSNKCFEGSLSAYGISVSGTFFMD